VAGDRRNVSRFSTIFALLFVRRSRAEKKHAITNWESERRFGSLAEKMY